MGEASTSSPGVAALHHMPLVAALEQMHAKLKPGGRLVIVGLSANKTAWDWIVSGVQVLPIRLLSKLRGESGYPGMTVARPSESLAEIRHISRTVLQADGSAADSGTAIP